MSRNPKVAALLVLLFSWLAAATSAHAQSAAADCDYTSAGSNGGYGWNPVTQQSCPPLENTGSQPISSSDQDCDYTTAALYDGWGWNPLTLSSCPPLANTTSSDGRPVCTTANADPDGDGFGWENDRTCLVSAGSVNPAPVSPAPVNPPGAKPVCSSALVDPDGDGYGWENDRSCIVSSTNPDSTNPDPNNPEEVALSPVGVISTGTPVYRWPAVANADKYRLIIRDAGGNGFTHEIDAFAANCQTGTGSCSAQPDTGYFDNFLNWSVQAVVNGASQSVAGPVSFKTPVSPDLQPISSNTGACEAYPAMAYDKYVIVNNIWNARAMYRSGWSQTISLDQVQGSAPVASWKYDWLQESDGGIYDVKSYPEVVYGNKLGVHISGSKAETGLPEKVVDLQEFKVDYSFTHDFDAEVNVALESFFHSSCNITGPCDDVDNRIFEMMIWVQNPTVRTPGDLALTGVMIDNKLWDVYIKPRSNKKYIAFTAQTDQSSGTINWNRFVDWTVEWTKNNAEELEINQLSTDYCMGAIEIGTEVFNGKGNFKLDRYNISRL